ncbi:MAG: exosortase O [Desulfobacterium sp.]|nr:exosortase O [Desulfobacterium sp.]
MRISDCWMPQEIIMTTMIHNDRSICSPNALLKIVLLALWTIGHWPTFLWLSHKSSQRPDVILIVIFLSIALGFAIYIAKIGGDIYAAKPAMLLFLIAVCGSISNALTISFRQADLMLWMLGVYGWLGLNHALWPKWSRVLNIGILVAFAVPFYMEFSSGLGFGLRLLTASLVEGTLEIVGINAISSQDIIITENSIAHVDIPCSGLKSIWVGSAFFIAVLALLNIKITLSTIWKYCIFVLLLLSANMFRVLILTVLTSIYHLPKIAEALHVPIGILGFAINCCAAWFMLDRSIIFFPQNDLMPKVFSDRSAKYFLFLIFFLIGWQATATLYDKPTAIPNNITPVTLPAILQLHSLPLTDGEKRYFSPSEQTIASKWGFTLEKNIGSILLVQSRDFNMFHAPELCMAANGIVVDKMETIRITPDRRVRVMVLNGGQVTGIYWLQSGKYMTDSFGERYWRYLWTNEKKWHMVSIIIDKPLSFTSDVIEKVIEPFYAAVSESNYESTIVQ